MNTESEDKIYKKGVGIGIAIGALSVFIIAGIAIGIIFSKKWEVRSANSALTLGNDVVEKINTLVRLTDKEFLYEYDSDEMKNSIYRAVMDSLGDPYTRYYTPTEFNQLMEENEGTFYGIGVVVTLDADKGGVLVSDVYKNSPAQEAGVLPGDRLIGAGDVSFIDMDLDTAVSHIRGMEGTYVDINIDRDGETFTLHVERRKVDMITVDYEMKENKIGYISVSQFEGITERQFISAFDDLSSQGMAGLIIDVRNNPGGRVDTVCNMLDKLLPEGIIVYIEDKNNKRQVYNSNAACDLDVPCVVLVNENSASASEIFAGALQDHKKATIIGQQTFGKGIVQSIIPLSDGSAIKITTEDYYTPNGNNIHKIGITPDVVVELDKEAYKNDNIDTQLEKAIEYIKGELK